jgi:hypothetical protein
MAKIEERFWSRCSTNQRYQRHAASMIWVCLSWFSPGLGLVRRARHRVLPRDRREWFSGCRQ